VPTYEPPNNLWVKYWNWYTGEDDGYNVGHNGPQGLIPLLWHGPKRELAKFMVKGSDSGGIYDAMYRAFFHEKSTTYVGPALELIQADYALIKIQAQIAIGIKSNSKYGNEAFPLDDITVGARFGHHGSMLTDATYYETWMLRAADITFSDIRVNEQGDIAMTITVNDKLDLRPDWGGETRKGLRGFAYNLYTQVLGNVWHDLIGASDVMETTATWETVLPARQDPFGGR
jgi:hypothetical protein